MRDFAIYTLARIGLFAASFAIVAGIWMLVTSSDGLPVLLPSLVIAAVVSAVGSYYLLQGPRARFAARVDARATAMTRRLEEARSKEDDD